jgi:hypothetical protein
VPEGFQQQADCSRSSISVSEPGSLLSLRSLPRLSAFDSLRYSRTSRRTLGALRHYQHDHRSHHTLEGSARDVVDAAGRGEGLFAVEELSLVA